MTATNDSPLRRKHHATPNAAITTPAIAGPMTRDAGEDGAVEPDRVGDVGRAGTISGTKARRAGLSSAVTTPSPKARTYTIQTSATPSDGDDTEHEREHTGSRGGPDEDAALVDPVDEHAGPRAEEQHRRELDARA